jgi:hypothetical protein
MLSPSMSSSCAFVFYTSSYGMNAPVLIPARAASLLEGLRTLSQGYSDVQKVLCCSLDYGDMHNC